MFKICFIYNYECYPFLFLISNIFVKNKKDIIVRNVFMSK